MCYEQLIRLCRLKNIKPTQLAKLLGFSPSNFKRWEEGGAINSDILIRIAKYFDIPVDFILEENSLKAAMLIEIKKSITTAHQISKEELFVIAEFLRCSPSYLTKDNNLFSDEKNVACTHDAAFLISEILCSISGSTSYRFLQIRISEIIIQNIVRSGVSKENLLNIGIDSIEGLLNNDMPTEEKIPLNYFNVITITRKLNISYEKMLRLS